MQKKQTRSKLIDFDITEDRFMMMQFSEDFKGSIERYLLHGYKPGGFGESMLANDLERALYTADTHNRKVFWAIAMWIRERMPEGSWGSYDAVDAWSRDVNGCRTAFRDQFEKETVWLTLVK